MARDLLHDWDGTLADERDGHRMGAHAVARDAAGGVGGAEEGGSDLSVLGSALPALELPGRKAAEVNVEPLNSRRSAVVGDLNLELYLIQLDRCATYRARSIDPGPAHVRSGRMDGNFPARIASRALERRSFSSGMVALQGSGEVVMPDATRPGRLFASPWEPGGRRLLAYAHIATVQVRTLKVGTS